MPQIARVVAAGMPHHVTQRGNRRQLTFFRDSDYQQYMLILAEECARNRVEIWSYCLMPNHVHLVAVPETEDGLAKVMRETHKKYTSLINARNRWTGCLWQGRFWSYVMDEPHLIAAARYIELNPVTAGMLSAAWEYPWSSARINCEGKTDVLMKRSVIPGLVSGWRDALVSGIDEKERALIEAHSRSGLPLGSSNLVAELERRTGRTLQIRGRGRPRRATAEQQPSLL